MARSDLLIALVKAGSAGDKTALRSAAEAIIAEERAKQHNILADRLTSAIQANGVGTHPKLSFAEPSSRARDFIVEITPQRRLDDLILPDVCRHGIEQLIEEQQRTSLLRAHGIDPRHRH